MKLMYHNSVTIIDCFLNYKYLKFRYCYESVAKVSFFSREDWTFTELHISEMKKKCEEPVADTSVFKNNDRSLTELHVSQYR